MYEEALKLTGEKQVSHRNEVYAVTLGDTPCIRKRYIQEGVSQTEYETLKKLYKAGVRVPEILAFDGDNIVLSFIDGVTYEAVLGAYEDGTMTEDEAFASARALASWLFGYYAALKRKRGDINLRNFIWNGENCFGVDFEEAPDKAPFEEDAGRMLTYTAAYRPICTQKKARFCRELVKAFRTGGMDVSLIRRFALTEVSDMAARRPKMGKSAPEIHAFIEKLFEEVLLS